MNSTEEEEEEENQEEGGGGGEEIVIPHGSAALIIGKDGTIDLYMGEAPEDNVSRGSMFLLALYRRLSEEDGEAFIDGMIDNLMDKMELVEGEEGDIQ